MTDRSIKSVEGPSYLVAIILTIAFSILKIFDLTDISWIMVLSPIWISFGLLLITFIILTIIITIKNS